LGSKVHFGSPIDLDQLSKLCKIPKGDLINFDFMWDGAIGQWFRQFFVSIPAQLYTDHHRKV
jgi:hypothetical protein